MKWFGEGPLTERDQKFFNLRESGYTGPIDQNGNAVDDVDEWTRDQRSR